MLTALIVNTFAPAGMETGVKIVRTDEPDVVNDGGLKLYVAPLGSPLTLKLMLPVNPFWAATLTVMLAELPGGIACEIAVAESVKFCTFKLTPVALALLPQALVTVSE